MAKLEYVPTKRGINENGNKAWTYKNAEAFEHVFGYILTPERGIILVQSLFLWDMKSHSYIKTSLQ